MKNWLYAIFCCLVACTSKSIDDVSPAICVDDMELCNDFNSLFSENACYDVIPLKVDSCCIPYVGMKLQIENENFLLGDLQFSNIVYRYGFNGEFINTIGCRGNGANEYPVLKDFTVLNDTINIVSLGSPGDCIFNYNIKGEFIGKVEIPNKIVSLARNSAGEYIVNSGRNVYNSSWQITHYSSDWKVLGEYFELDPDENNVPIIESNFSVNEEFVFYHESFNNQLYVLKDTIKPTYRILFDGADDMRDIHKGSFVKAVEGLYKKGFYLVNSYVETDNLLCLILSYLKDTKTQKQVWIIFDKQRGMGHSLEILEEELFVGDLCVKENSLYCMVTENFVRKYIKGELLSETDIYMLKIKL